MIGIFWNCSKRNWLLSSKAAMGGQFGRRGYRSPLFQDSLTCINYADPERTNPCNECQLIDFVENENRSEEVPCHFIALNEAGETLKHWMKAKIEQIETERATSAARKQSAA